MRLMTVFENFNCCLSWQRRGWAKIERGKGRIDRSMINDCTNILQIKKLRFNFKKSMNSYYLKQVNQRMHRCFLQIVGLLLESLGISLTL